MIWHIFKKDLRILWPVAAVVAAVHWVNAVLLCFGGQFERADGNDGWVSNIALPLLGLLGLVILVLLVLQQDRFPGTTQDWLTRPIARHQLIAGKMLFIVLAGLGPVLLADITMGLVAQLRAPDVIAASLTRTLVLYVFVCLPASIVGIVTRSLAEALVFAMAVVVLLALEMIASTGFTFPLPVLRSGFAWTISLVLLAANLLATAVIFALQVRWRSTNRVRWIAGAYLCATPAVVFLPWTVAFGLQRALEDATDVPAMSVRVDDERKTTFSDAVLNSTARPGLEVNLTIPVSEVAPGQGGRWQREHIVATVIEPSGATMQSSSGEGVDAWENSPNRYGDRSISVFMSHELFQKARAAHGAVRLTLFITRFRLAAGRTVASMQGRSIDPFSYCARGYQGMMSCVSTRPVGTCIRFEDRPNRRTPRLLCRGANYAVWPLPLWRDPYYTVAVNSTVGIEYEESEAMSTGSVAAIASLSNNTPLDQRGLLNYVPDAHFTQSLTVTLDRVTEQDQEFQGAIDGIGAAARFNSAGGVAIDSRGNLFVLDEEDSTIRKVSPAGEVTTYAGRARQIGADDGPVREARFNRPQGITVDAADNLYVADTGNGLIRKISPAGIVSTIAGNTVSLGNARGAARLLRPTHVACARDGSLYVIDLDEQGSPWIGKVLPDGTVSALAGATSTRE